MLDVARAAEKPKLACLIDLRIGYTSLFYPTKCSQATMSVVGLAIDVMPLDDEGKN